MKDKEPDFRLAFSGTTPIYGDFQSASLIITFDEVYTAFLCLPHEDLEVDLNPGLSLRMRRKGDPHIRPALICMRSPQLQSLLRRIWREGLALTGNLGKLLVDKPPLPPFLNKMGWSSSVAFGTDVSHAKVIDAIAALKEEEIQVGFVLIDEGWEKTTEGKLTSFSADPEKFPSGLRALTSALKHLGVAHFGVWHALQGGRKGIDGHLSPIYGQPGEELGNSFRFFYDFYSHLKSQGVTFTRIGSQRIENQTRARHLHTAIQAASAIHFNAPHLNSDFPTAPFYWTSSRIARSGPRLDLANPTETKKAVRDHLATGTWLRHIMQSDIDALITTGEEAETAAIFHALSGTFQTLGDAPGCVDCDLLSKIALPSGRILRPNAPLTLTSDSLFVDPVHEKKPYKAYTLCRNAGVMALFNLHRESSILHTQISAAEIGLSPHTSYALFSMRHGLIGTTAGALAHEIRIDQSDVYTFAPIENGIALIGCHHFFLPQGPIVEVHGDEGSYHISSRIAGPILIYCERDILEVRRSGEVIPWDQNKETHLVSLDHRGEIKERPCLYTVTFEN